MLKNNLKPQFNKEFLMRAESREYLLVHNRTFTSYIISDTLHYLLLLCNGVNTIEDISNILNMSPEIVNKNIELLHNINVLYFKEDIKKHDQVIPEKNVDIETPIMISWLITGNCNLKCRHCYLDCPDRGNHNELSSGEATRVIEKLSEAGVFSLDISGGEPFTRPDIVDICRNAHDSGIKIGICTNGILINDGLIKNLVKYDVNTIQVSLDGATKSVHEFIRGKGTYEPTVTNIKKMVDSGLQVRLTMTYHRGNLHELYDIIEMALETGIKAIQLGPLHPWGRAKNGLGDYILSYAEQVAFNRQLIPIVNKLKPRLDLILDRARQTKNKASGCRATISAAICPDGDVVPCDVFAPVKGPGIVMGNIMNGSLKNIWNSDNANVLKRNASISQRPCVSCEHLIDCSSYCMAEIFIKERKFIPGADHFKLCKKPWK